MDKSSSALSDRLSFIGLNEQSCEKIRSIKAILDKELPVALDLTPETSKFFKNARHMDSAKAAQIGHWSSISAGKFDDRYLADVRKVGQTHARIDANKNGVIELTELYSNIKPSIVADMKGLQTPWLARSDMVGEVPLF